MSFFAPRRHVCQLLALVVLVCGGASLAAAHPGQNISLRIAIRDEAVTHEIVFSADLVSTFLEPQQMRCDIELTDDGEFVFSDAEQKSQIQSLFTNLITERCPVAIDGITVKPLVRGFKFVPALNPMGEDSNVILPPDLRLDLEFPTKGAPKRVSLVWGIFPETATGPALPTLDGSKGIFAELDAYRNNSLVLFSEKEPEIVWHASARPVEEEVTAVEIVANPAALAVPIVSVVIVVAWVAILAASVWVKRWKRMRLALVVLAVFHFGLAFTLRHRAIYHMELPWATADVPDQAEAVEIFTSLQRNIYRAFDYKSESDVYDVLAQSVAGELLDRIYNEVYQSLIMRDEGGAMARVESVDVLDAALESGGVAQDDKSVAFRIKSRWRVNGAVHHWGHVHRRTNEYNARFTIAQRDGTWKITDVETLAQERVQEETGTPSPPAGS